MTIAKAEIAEPVKYALMRIARRNDPLEVCGFIMNSADPDTEQFVMEVPNVHPAPLHNWRMDERYQSVVMEREGDVFAVWHSHPRGPDGPSTTDLRYMLPGIRFFVVTGNGVFEYEMGQ